MSLLERGVPLVREVEVVPGDLVAEHRRPLERAQALGGDHLVVLVDVVEARLEDGIRLPLLPEGDQQLEDVLAALGERAHLEVVHRQLRLGDAELGGRLAHLARQRVGREAFRERLRRDRERDVPHLGAALDEARHRPAAAELAVVGVRREDEHLLPGLDHAGGGGGGGGGRRDGGLQGEGARCEGGGHTVTLSTGPDGGGSAAAVAGAGFHRRTGISEHRAVSPSSPQNTGSSNSAL